MLKRKFYAKLLEWKRTKNQTCLLVKGARQIGKTYIIDYFGRMNYASYIYINFIETPKAKDISARYGSSNSRSLIVILTIFRNMHPIRKSPR